VVDLPSSPFALAPTNQGVVGSNPAGRANQTRACSDAGPCHSQPATDGSSLCATPYDYLVHYPGDAVREGKRSYKYADASRHPLGNVIVVGPALREIAGDEERKGGDDEAEHGVGRASVR